MNKKNYYLLPLIFLATQSFAQDQKILIKNFSALEKSLPEKFVPKKRGKLEEDSKYVIYAAAAVYGVIGALVVVETILDKLLRR